MNGRGVEVEGDRARPEFLRWLTHLVQRGWWLVAVSALLGAVCAMSWSLLQTPIYSSNARAYVSSSSPDGGANAAYQGSLASEQRVASYAELVQSDVVVRRTLEQSGLTGLSPEDVAEALSASTSPDTVLLSIEARSTEPAIAITLANSAANALSEYVRTLEEPVGGGPPLAKLSIVSPAGAPVVVSPSVLRNVVLGLLAGGFLGLLIFSVRDRLDSVIRTESGLAEVSSFPVLGAVPHDQAIDNGGVVEFGLGSTPAAEEFRRIRTNLSVLGVDESSERLLITSATAAEGKSSTVLNLAAAIAESGERVIVVDADLRRPTIARRLSLNAEVGLTMIFRGDASVDEVLQKSSISRLDILAGGPAVPNASELLASQKFAEILDHLASLYDYVLVDTPPVLAVADAAAIGQHVDGCIVVARCDRTKERELVLTLSRLEAAKTAIFGMILNDSSDSSEWYGYGYSADATQSGSV